MLIADGENRTIETGHALVSEKIIHLYVVRKIYVVLQIQYSKIIIIKNG